jgi:hypothetical protein
MRLPRPLRIPVATISIVATIAVFFGVVAFAAFGFLYGDRPR